MDDTGINRRTFLHHASGLGGLALASMLHSDLNADEVKMKAIRKFAPRAKRVISLFMSGGPSHVDLFDPKPILNKMDGQLLPESVGKGVKFAAINRVNGKAQILGSPCSFKKYGQNGIDISNLLPHTSKIADELCVIRSLHSESFNHGPAVSFMNTGSPLYGRPTMGSWLSYGLGNENKNLPTFIVLQSGHKIQPLVSTYWSNGFLPSKHQGVILRSQGDPILYLKNPKGVSSSIRRKQLDLLKKSNEQKLQVSGDPKIESRINSYELAYRMQTSVPEIMDIKKEPKKILELYGASPGKKSFANNCLLARRLAEKGVRFIQLFDMGWDQHYSLKKDLERQTRGVDQATFALISDLKQRGLLKDTLVIWGGEFGRTPVAQGKGKKIGRDHHPHGFTMWMAGGGVKPGLFGSTDEFGFHARENKTSIFDLNATILHLLGVDHKALTYRFQGRDFRLTDVHGKIIKDIII
ncbi:MAG: DUF1501 domain-containing protein [Lentisphaerales bacterium]|nr:DUF1501 domain-containing protein [Lentisphaerales bacterium]